MQNPNNKEIGADGKYYSGYHGYWPSDLEKTRSASARWPSSRRRRRGPREGHQGDRRLRDEPRPQERPATRPPRLVLAQRQRLGGNCVCGEGCGWDGDQGKRCWFRDYLPDFNFQNAAARKLSVDNAIWWIEQTGIDGFRLDAVKHIEDAWLLDLRSRVDAEVECERSNTSTWWARPSPATSASSSIT
jgi:glycosidase